MKRTLSLTLLTAALILTACAGSGLPEEETPPPGQPTSPPASETAQPETPPPDDEDESRADERERMVSQQIAARGVRDSAVLEAMRTVPRHEFVPQELQASAYNDHPLPIGYGQTISQPYIVALMTEKLELEPDMRVLEIGTGSGYQAAILAEIVEEVYSVEIIEPLAVSAEERLASLGYDNVHVLRADGYYGWEEHAPFDAIIVTAAPDHIPQPLVEQMSDPGRMVIPVGPVGAYQELWLLIKTGEDIQQISLGGVSFVPFTREEE